MPRYPIRARKRQGRLGSYRSLAVVGGAASTAVETTDAATVEINIQVVETVYTNLLAAKNPTAESASPLWDAYNTTITRVNEIPAFEGTWVMKGTNSSPGDYGFSIEENLTLVPGQTYTASVAFRCNAAAAGRADWYVTLGARGGSGYNGTPHGPLTASPDGWIRASSPITIAPGDNNTKLVLFVIDNTPSPASTTSMAAYGDDARLYQVQTQDTHHAVDQTTVTYDIQPSGVEVREIPDAATVLIDIQPSGTELKETLEAATVTVDIQPSGTELKETLEADTVLIDIQPSGVDVYAVGARRPPWRPIITGGIAYQDRSRW